MPAAPASRRGPHGLYLDRLLPETDFDTADARLRAALAASGFGVMTEIDVQKTLKAKLGVDIPAHRILGACNPGLAWRVLQAEPRVGVMLPCNVTLRAVEGGTEISAVDPVASMQAIDNPALTPILEEVRALLARMLETV